MNLPAAFSTWVTSRSTVSFNNNLAPEEWTKWNLMWNPLMAQLPLTARGY